MNRAELKQKIKDYEVQISRLQEDKRTLIEQEMMLSDNVQRFTETKEVIPTHIKEKYNVSSETAMLGKIWWTENIKDEDTGEYLKISRSRVVRINGTWIF